MIKKHNLTYLSDSLYINWVSLYMWNILYSYVIIYIYVLLDILTILLAIKRNINLLIINKKIMKNSSLIINIFCIFLLILEINLKMEDHYYAIKMISYNIHLLKIWNLYHKILLLKKKKEGDDYLIELYIERKHLYDKSHRDFKNKQIRENAWVKISNTMQEKT